MAKTRERMRGPGRDRWQITVYRKSIDGECYKVERTPEFILQGGLWVPHVRHGGWFYPVRGGVQGLEKYILVEAEERIKVGEVDGEVAT